MVDRAARKELICITKNFVGGRITNDEFEDQFFDLMDDAKEGYLWLVWDNGLRLLYGDACEYKCVGKDKLGCEEKKYAARLILFLQSDFKYSWPDPMSIRQGKSDVTQTMLILSMLLGLLISLSKSDYQHMLLFLLLLIFVPIWIYSIFYDKRVNEKNKREADAYEAEIEKRGFDYDIWPFSTLEEYEYALAHPVYLAGKKTM